MAKIIVESNLILGSVVFGTMRGLFAEGEGELSSISASAHVFEFGRTHRDESLIPREDEIIYFRRAIADDTKRMYDLIGLCCGAVDLSGRPGFLGYCVAVPYGNGSAYEPAFRQLADGLTSAAEFFFHSGQQFRDMHGKRFFHPASRAQFSTVRYNLIGDVNRAKYFFFDERAEASKGRILEALIELAAFEGRAATTIAVSNRRRDQAEQITDRLIKEYRERNEARERSGEMGRPPVSSLDNGELVDGGTASGLSERVLHLERRMEKLEGLIRKLEVEAADGGGRIGSRRLRISEARMGNSGRSRYDDGTGGSRLWSAKNWIRNNWSTVFKWSALYVVVALCVFLLVFLVDRIFLDGTLTNQRN